MSAAIIKVKDSHFQESFEQFLNQCRQKIDFDRLSITLKVQNQFVIFALVTEEDKEPLILDCGSTFELESSASLHCITTKETLINNITADNYSENEYLKKTNFKTAVHFPLILHSTIVGTLDIISLEENHYSESDIKFVEEVIFNLNLLLENYNLQTIIRKSGSILAHDPNDLEYLIGTGTNINTNITNLPDLEEYLEDLTQVSDTLFIEDAQGKLIQVTQKLAELLNYSADEMLGQAITNYCIDDDKDQLETLKSDNNAEATIHFKTKDNDSIPLLIKVFQLQFFMSKDNIVVYQAQQQTYLLPDEVFRNVEDTHGIVDLNYHLQYVSPSLKDKFDEQLIGRKCFLAYNKSSKICPNCPIENDKVKVDELRNHVVFTEFKDGKKMMIFFSIVKKDDGSIVLMEYFKNEALRNQISKSTDTETDTETSPQEVNDFIDQSLSKIKTPVMALVGFSSNLKNSMFSELDPRDFSEKTGYIYDTARHIESVVSNLDKMFREKIDILTTIFEQNEETLSGIMDKLEVNAKPGKSILLIDHQEYTRNTLSSFLSKQGYQISTAKDGLEGILETKKHLPDMLLLDINIPRVNGLLLVEKIHQHIKKKIPAIFISDNQDQQNINKAFSVGGAGYLKKTPLELKEIAELIFEVFSRIEKAEEERRAIALTQKPKPKPKPQKTPKQPSPPLVVDKTPTESESVSEVDLSQAEMAETSEEEILFEAQPNQARSETELVDIIDKPDSFIPEESIPISMPSETDDISNLLADEADIPIQPEQPGDKDVTLTELGINLEESIAGKILDFGLAEGIKHSIKVDENVVVMKIGGYLTETNLIPILDELIETVTQQKSPSKKILLNLNDVIEASLNKTILNDLFSFTDIIPNLDTSNIILLCSHDRIISHLRSHPKSKKFSIYDDFINAFSRLQIGA